jgi:hypothetical protein
MWYAECTGKVQNHGEESREFEERHHREMQQKVMEHLEALDGRLRQVRNPTRRSRWWLWS